MNNKIYIGDSVYVDFDGYNLILTTENGLANDPSNTIILEPHVWRNLTEYVERNLKIRVQSL
jgi:hypothetical protein